MPPEYLRVFVASLIEACISYRGSGGVDLVMAVKRCRQYVMWSEKPSRIDCHYVVRRVPMRREKNYFELGRILK